MPIARAKKGRCPAEGEGLMDVAGRDVERPTFNYQSAARRGFEVAAATEAVRRFRPGWPNERS